MVHITTQAPEIKGCVETLRNGTFVNFFESKGFFFKKKRRSRIVSEKCGKNKRALCMLIKI